MAEYEEKARTIRQKKEKIKKSSKNILSIPYGELKKIVFDLLKSKELLNNEEIHEEVYTILGNFMVRNAFAEKNTLSDEINYHFREDQQEEIFYYGLRSFFENFSEDARNYGLDFRITLQRIYNLKNGLLSEEDEIKLKEYKNYEDFFLDNMADLLNDLHRLINYCLKKPYIALSPYSSRHLLNAIDLLFRHVKLKIKERKAIERKANYVREFLKLLEQESQNKAKIIAFRGEDNA